MSDEIQNLRDGVAYVAECLRALHAEIGDTEPSDDQRAAWDAGVEYVEQTEAQIERTEKRAAELERAAKLTERVGSMKLESGDGAATFNVNTRTDEDPHDLSTVRAQYGSARDSEIRDRALAYAENGRYFTEDAHREAATRKIEKLGNKNRVAEQILLAGSPEYRSAFFKKQADAEHEITAGERARMGEVDDILRSTGFWDGVNEAEQRALALTNVTGKLVPSHLDPTVVLTNDGAANPFRAISRVESVSTNVWTGVSTAGITGGWTGAEATEVDDDTPTFANPSVTCYMADAFVPLSFQAYEDWTGAEGELMTLIADYKDILEEAAFATGDGSNKPTGIVTAMTAIGTTAAIASGRWVFNATNSAYTVNDLFEIKQGLGQRYKPNASWVMAEEYLDRIRAFGTDDYYGQTVNLTAGDIPIVLGKRTYESTTMTGLLSTTTNYHTVYGDFRNYLIADRVGLAVEFVPNLFHTGANRPSASRGWLAHWRVGADSINDTGFVLGVNQNTAAAGV